MVAKSLRLLGERRDGATYATGKMRRRRQVLAADSGNERPPCHGESLLPFEREPVEW